MTLTAVDTQAPTSSGTRYHSQARVVTQRPETGFFLLNYLGEGRCLGEVLGSCDQLGRFLCLVEDGRKSHPGRIQLYGFPLDYYLDAEPSRRTLERTKQVADSQLKTYGLLASLE